MVYEFDNSKKTGLNEHDIATLTEMRASIPDIEKLLQKYGKLIDGGMDMWYTGFSWYLVLKGKPPVMMVVEYSDKRFRVQASRFCSNEKARDKAKYPKGYPAAKELILHSTDFFKYELCDFPDWVTLDRLPDVIESFVEFIRPNQFGCEIESDE